MTAHLEKHRKLAEALRWLTSTHLHEVGQALEQLAEGEEPIFTWVERGSVDSQVTLAKLFHLKTLGDMLLLGHK